MIYQDLSKSEKKDIIYEMYVNKQKSFKQIADELSTYANKIRRDAISFKIPIRDKSEAQKNALNVGNTKHPTKGTKRDDKTKLKIGKGVLENWKNLSLSEIDARKLKAKEQWDKLSEDEKENLINKANSAVRTSSKTGSKLENYLFKKLLAHGYEVHFHQEQMLSNTKLQIDLFLPKLNIAIEVDGPSHFMPVWGDAALQRNIKYDNKKTGLLLGKGCVLIRIKQLKDYSPTRASMILDELLIHIKDISKKFPENNRLIEIGD
jgi:very-short-patch-repair endonuclease